MASTRYFLGSLVFIGMARALLQAGYVFKHFPAEKRVFFISGTTLSLFLVLSFVITGSIFGATYEYVYFVGVVIPVGIVALIKAYFKDKNFKSKRL